TITAIRQGLLNGSGVLPPRVTQFYPLVITLEHIPMTHFLYKEIQSPLKSKGLLASEGVKPLQSVDVRELERIEAIASSGWTLKQLLDEKLSSTEEAEDSFTNYLYRRKKTWGDLENGYLKEQWRTLSEKAKEFFRARERKNTLLD